MSDGTVSRTVRVSRTDVQAAKLQLATDRALGRDSDPLIVRLAGLLPPVMATKDVTRPAVPGGKIVPGRHAAETRSDRVRGIDNAERPTDFKDPMSADAGATISRERQAEPSLVRRIGDVDSGGPVVEPIEMEFVDDEGRHAELSGSLSYDARDPYAISMIFATEPPVTWTFSRELLATGMDEPAGHGDVHVWPCLSVEGHGVVIFEFSSPDGEVLVQAGMEECSRFVRRMLESVPLGNEVDHVDFDEVLDLLFVDPDDPLRRSMHTTTGRLRDPWGNESPLDQEEER